MKKSIFLAASLLALNLTPVFGQQPATPPADFAAVIAKTIRSVSSPADAQQLIEQQHQRMLGPQIRRQTSRRH